MTKSRIEEHFLQLNQGKADILIIDPRALRKKLLSKLQTLYLNPYYRSK